MIVLVINLKKKTVSILVISRCIKRNNSFGLLHKVFLKTNIACSLIRTGCRCFQEAHINDSYKQDTKCPIKSYLAKYKVNCHIRVVLGRYQTFLIVFWEYS